MKKDTLIYVIVGGLITIAGVGNGVYDGYKSEMQEEARIAVQSGKIDLNSKWHLAEMTKQRDSDEQEAKYQSQLKNYAREHYVVTKKDAQDIEEMIAKAQNKDLNSTRKVTR